jgi:hypothetical protein
MVRVQRKIKMIKIEIKVLKVLQPEEEEGKKKNASQSCMQFDQPPLQITLPLRLFQLDD